MIRYLTELGRSIAANGRKAEIVIAGGASMVLLVGNREVTKDIDAYSGEDPKVVRAAAAGVAE